MASSFAEFQKMRDKSQFNTTPLEIRKVSGKDIAIIGMAVELAGAHDPQEFWNLLRDGTDCIQEFPEARRRDTNGYLRYMKYSKPIEYIPGAFLPEIDKFDYKFFKLSPKEASLLAPHQRLFLETTWKAIEDAGYGGEKLTGSNTGIYLGFSNFPGNLYHRMIDDIEPSFSSLALPGNLPLIIASRISYLLDLTGPALLIDTACSSSLVAIHTACQGLRNKECEMAIAGSVNLHILPLRNSEHIGIASRDGKTRSFHEGSDGTGSGEGVASILLKPLTKALDDGDHIYAVIKGSAVNQDGRSGGITAPNPKAQEQVIKAAWENAGVDPRSITYIEAHGTGTPLGDPIEIQGITRAFAAFTEHRQFCALGSVKTNIGHLDSAAGIFGTVKTVLALQHGQLPPSIHFQKPNRNVDFGEAPVYFNDHLNPWPSGEYPRRCGVSSFSLGGTNCHLILEESSAPSEPSPLNTSSQNELAEPQIITISAKSESSFGTLIAAFREFIIQRTGWNLGDLCYTANTGRGHYQYRVAIVFSSREELIAKLEQAVTHPWDPDAAGAGIYFRERNPLNMAPSPVLEVELKKLLAEYGNRKKDGAFFKRLGEFYRDGASINWEEIYQGECRKKISLPTYPFERTRCWISIPEATERFYYQTAWKTRSLTIPGPMATQKYQGGILVFKDGGRQGEALIQRLRQAGLGVTEVERGEQFQQMSTHKFMIGHLPEDYQRLFYAIPPFQRIIYLAQTPIPEEKTGPIGTWEEAFQSEIAGLFHLLQALLKHTQSEIDLLLVANQVYEVTGAEDKLHPEKAVLFGLGKVVYLESLRVRIRCLDTDETTSAEAIFTELQAGYQEYQVAYRQGKRYIAELQSLPIGESFAQPIRWKKDGIYLITGGMGKIGLHLAKYLCFKHQIKIALLQRTRMPSKPDWDLILSTNSDPRICQGIKAIRELEKSETEVECCAVDITDPRELEKSIGYLRSKYGKINGIIHAAAVGVGSSGSRLEAENLPALLEVLKPKLIGTKLLHRFTQDDDLDFFALFSSAITLTGGVGSGSYVAANSFLDAYASQRARLRKRTIAINWPAWVGTHPELNIHSEKQLFHEITVDEALTVFDAITGRDLPRVIVGELNYESEILGFEKMLPFSLAPHLKTEIQRTMAPKAGYDNAGHGFGKVHLMGRENNLYSRLEEQIAGVWGQILGLTEVGIDDSFYDNGGDSLIALKIINSLNQRLGFKTEVADLLRYPTVAGFAACLQLKNQERTAVSFLTIEPAPPQEYYSLSSAQKRMYILHQFEGAQLNYNMPAVIKIIGPLDKSRLENALRALIGRHEVLRTSFPIMNEGPVQRIQAQADSRISAFRIEYRDWIEGEDSIPPIQSIIPELIRPFDLAAAPLLRVHLFKTGAAEFYLFYDMHHIISDMTSVNIFMRELFALYQGKDLPELRVQYKDFSEWQMRWLESDSIRQMGKYWLERFSGGLSLLEMPADYPRPPVPSYRGESLNFPFETELLPSLDKMAAETGATLYMVLLAVCYVLLYKYTRQHDLIVGSPVSGRERLELENMMGVFANMICLRNTLHEQITFREFLQMVKENTLNDFLNQEYPFDLLIENLNLPRDTSRSPLFSIVFALQNADFGSGNFGGLQVSMNQFEFEISPYELLFTFRRSPNELVLNIRYRSELYQSETIQKMGRHFSEISRQIIANPEIYLRDIQLISEFERQKLITGLQKELNRNPGEPAQKEPAKIEAEFDL